MSSKEYESVIITLILFDASVKTDIISASRWDVGEPDIDWNE